MSIAGFDNDRQTRDLGLDSYNTSGLAACETAFGRERTRYAKTSMHAYMRTALCASAFSSRTG